MSVFVIKGSKSNILIREFNEFFRIFQNLLSSSENKIHSVVRFLTPLMKFSLNLKHLSFV